MKGLEIVVLRNGLLNGRFRIGVTAAVIMLGTDCRAFESEVQREGREALPQTLESKGAVFSPPAETSIPGGAMGESIKRGLKYLTLTKETLPAYVGNDLHCTSCHLNAGRTPHAAPWVGITGVFPEFRPRNAKVNILEDRVNDCFERSMSGKPLPMDSAEMRDIVAYMTWLSQGVPVGVEVPGRGFKKLATQPTPSEANGKLVYAAKCTVCHGDDGSGKAQPDGSYMFPALWGKKSYNIGAGMARLHTAASFVKHNMPLGAGNTLSDQEAYDVSAYFIQQARPDFAAKDKDWPKGGKPSDARY